MYYGCNFARNIYVNYPVYQKTALSIHMKERTHIHGNGLISLILSTKNFKGFITSSVEI